MATYFPSPSNQRDADQTFQYFRQSLPDSYSEASNAPENMMVFMNYSSSGAYSDMLAGTSQQQHSCIDIPPVGATCSNTSQQEILSNLGGSRMGIQDFSSWRDSRNEMLAGSVFQVAQNVQGQGLSLSLGSSIPSGIGISHVQCQNPNQGGGFDMSFGDGDNSQPKEQRNAEYLPPGYPGSNSEAMKGYNSPYGTPSIASTIPSSKYLKAAQYLLDEVVSLRKAIKEQNSKKELTKDSRESEGDSKNKTSDPPANEGSNPHESKNNQSELSATEKQEVQNKLTKLLSMLDEIDRRYRQYYHQMQIVVSSFDVVAGDGAAKPYTALALRTISRHFRCLRDAICNQIRASRRSLGEQDASENSKVIGISRLRFVDQHIRQQRALQQLGMMQQHAWRPQRGLPESSVSVLRAWLFEHFLHPYPKDSDKIMLARQTGLTRSQVSNWFINARVRLWKPMVEEMYKEEAGDAKIDSNSSSEVAPRLATKDSKVEEREELHQNAASEFEQYNNGQILESKSNHEADVEMEGASNAETQSQSGMENQTEEPLPVMDNCTLFQVAFVQSNHRFSEFGSFGSGNVLPNGVSLTLGLQQGEGSNRPMSIETQVNYVPLRADDMYSTAPTTMVPETAEFNCLDSGNRQHPFWLLPSAT
ncbi:BEL1-like homeodomain protein 6 [Solanum dulcamara]|uniref:BEL1-like homeodomain protein 6 n=1 Tax=Solanum dulcamara TaxID=45834 RepID=UPI002486A1C9|nr:BEL1-like homeodomain protein 6 [Solanum dulcamara]XP_055815669.1 BEL1-like homeodomain protein 6 [Solanum dulcamara]